jgi:hypothetical protein
MRSWSPTYKQRKDYETFPSAIGFIVEKEEEYEEEYEEDCAKTARRAFRAEA